MKTPVLMRFLITLFIVPIFLSGCATATSPYSASGSSSSLNSLLIESIQENTSLHDAALMGNVEALKRLLAEGSNPNATDEHDFTPIHWAAASAVGHNREMIELLVQHGANPNLAKNSAQMVPLQFAHNAEAAQALIKAGARLDTRDIAQGTPLHSATKVDVAKVLLDNGADRTAKNGLNQTPAEKLRQMLPHFNQGGIHDTIKKQYQDVIAVLETYYPNQPGSAPTASTASSSWSDDTTPYTPAASANTAAPASSESDFDKAEKRAKELEAKQACPMYDYDWFYTGKDCQDDFAHGTGVAINPYENQEFEGKIEQGRPVEGTLRSNKNTLYEGSFTDGKPHGPGICFHEGSPEECRYYKGERIDTLHKQREEFKKQQELLSEMKNSQPSQSSVNDQTSGYNSSNYNNSNYNRYSEPDYSSPASRYDSSYSEPEDTSDPLTDAIQDELIEQGTKMLIDQFF